MKTSTTRSDGFASGAVLGFEHLVGNLGVPEPHSRLPVRCGGQEPSVARQSQTLHRAVPVLSQDAKLEAVMDPVIYGDRADLAIGRARQDAVLGELDNGVDGVLGPPDASLHVSKVTPREDCKDAKLAPTDHLLAVLHNRQAAVLILQEIRHGDKTLLAAVPQVVDGQCPVAGSGAQVHLVVGQIRDVLRTFCPLHCRLCRLCHPDIVNSHFPVVVPDGHRVRSQRKQRAAARRPQLGSPEARASLNV
mmetsp:Transcript_75493/g.175019  ORF Transcript_75493/g.175019 Transcript_75493/m.175019 type:complete len:248 (-) Transcript_75493:221-964(-)